MFRAAYYPEGNGFVERNHRTIKRIAERSKMSIPEAVYWYSVSANKNNASPMEKIYRYRSNVKGLRKDNLATKADTNEVFKNGGNIWLKPSNAKVIISAPLYTGKSATGVVFSCNPDDTNQCLKLNIETETLTDPDIVLSQKSNQWMGFSMSQAGDMLMSCAPLWHESRTGRNGINLWYRGRCSLIDKDLNNIYTYSACVNEPTGNVQYGYCESGFSSGGYIGGNTPTFYVGAPGSINSIGVLFAFIGGSVNASPIKLKTGTDQLIDESSLMGYSIAVGNFTNNQYGDVVGGAPRANNLKGIVILYTIGDTGFTLTQSYPNPDGQVGSYFGGAVCAVDLNNDGYRVFYQLTPKNRDYSYSVVKKLAGLLYLQLKQGYNNDSFELPLPLFTANSSQLGGQEKVNEISFENNKIEEIIELPLSSFLANSPLLADQEKFNEICFENYDTYEIKELSSALFIANSLGLVGKAEVIKIDFESIKIVVFE
nr:unnamed protein product [Hydra vulgaris]